MNQLVMIKQFGAIIQYCVNVGIVVFVVIIKGIKKYP